MAASWLVTCALSEGSVSCFGNGSDVLGNLKGLGPCTDGQPCRREPALVATSALSDSKVVQLAAGAYFMCARFDDGQVACWGSNEYGQLGPRAGTASSAEPVLVLAGAIDIAAGGHHACAVLTDHQVVCWGRNSAAQLAKHPSELESSSTPVAVEFAE